MREAQNGSYGFTGATLEPNVTVVIPTRNRPDLLVRAIQSCMQQAHGTLVVEIVVVDDASDQEAVASLDGIGCSVRAYRFDQQKGRGAARNYGLERARGEFVKFLDDDDKLEPDALSVEVDLAMDSGADLVVSGWREADRDDRNATRFDVVWTDRGYELPLEFRLPMVSG